mmetsp:Transcript_31560/g.75346  ORF Transcript_31560/g.75346 Transcript_31560/m.75346 type:complete len:222 (+) Transcript_31560:619-1284(+)
MQTLSQHLRLVIILSQPEVVVFEVSRIHQPRILRLAVCPEPAEHGGPVAAPAAHKVEAVPGRAPGVREPHLLAPLVGEERKHRAQPQRDPDKHHPRPPEPGAAQAQRLQPRLCVAAHARVARHLAVPARDREEACAVARGPVARHRHVRHALARVLLVHLVPEVALVVGALAHAVPRVLLAVVVPAVEALDGALAAREGDLAPQEAASRPQLVRGRPHLVV